MSPKSAKQLQNRYESYVRSVGSVYDPPASKMIDSEVSDQSLNQQGCFGDIYQTLAQKCPNDQFSGAVDAVMSIQAELEKPKQDASLKTIQAAIETLEDAVQGLRSPLLDCLQGEIEDGLKKQDLTTESRQALDELKAWVDQAST